MHKNHRFVSGELVVEDRLHGNAFIACLEMHKKTQKAASERALMSFLSSVCVCVCVCVRVLL